MTHTTGILIKPRVLIADDSRIVRATLIKHIEGAFEFREALNGEEAWDILLLDPSIRVVITDLTMPKLDGYGLLQRIRNSRVERIKTLPVVVVSGSDEQEERARAREAGATDLIVKGIGTAQLLSRLKILSELGGTQRKLDRSLGSTQDGASAMQSSSLPAEASLHTRVDPLLADAIKEERNFVLICMRIGLRHADRQGIAAIPPSDMMHSIGQLLRHAVRESDYVAQTGNSEWLVAASVDPDSAHRFGRRVCRTVANASMAKAEHMPMVVSCGLALLDEEDIQSRQRPLQVMLEVSRRRAMIGLNQAVTGLVGREEEESFERGDFGAFDDGAGRAYESSGDSDVPDVSVLLDWLREGRKNEVLPHIGKLVRDLQPLVEFMQEQRRP